MYGRGTSHYKSGAARMDSKKIRSCSNAATPMVAADEVRVEMSEMGQRV